MSLARAAATFAIALPLGCQAPRAPPPQDIVVPTASASIAIPASAPAPIEPAASDERDAGAEEPELDPRAWLAQRGVPEARRDAVEMSYGCREARLGSPPEPAIVCAQTNHVERGAGAAHVYRVLARRRAWVVRAGRPVAVLDVVESVGPLDKEDFTSGNLVDLRAALAPDGLSATVSDVAGACDTARASLERARQIEDSPWVRFDRELVERACAARGRWVWKRDRFAREP